MSKKRERLVVVEKALSRGRRYHNKAGVKVRLALFSDRMSTRLRKRQATVVSKKEVAEPEPEADTKDADGDTVVRCFR